MGDLIQIAALGSGPWIFPSPFKHHSPKHEHGQYGSGSGVAQSFKQEFPGKKPATNGLWRALSIEWSLWKSWSSASSLSEDIRTVEALPDAVYGPPLGREMTTTTVLEHVGVGPPHAAPLHSSRVEGAQGRLARFATLAGKGADQMDKVKEREMNAVGLVYAENSRVSTETGGCERLDG